MPPAADAPDPRRWWTLAVLCLSLLIVSIGNSSLTVAIPTLSDELHASNSQLQWVIAIYSLVFAGLLFSAGALSDRFGRKGTLQLGLVIFLAGASLASAATSMNQLIACRALMGIAAALIMPSTLSILVNVFPPHERTKAIAIWAATAGAASAVGPVATGLLLAHFWYGSVFLVNVPIVGFALVAGRVLIPRSKDPSHGRLDPLGAALSSVGIVSLVYGLIQAPEAGWSSTGTVTAFVVAAIVLGLFVAWERRVAEPMLDMSLFRNPSFSAASGGMTLVFLSMYGVVFLIVQYLQLVLGYSAFEASLRFLPLSPIMVIVATRTPGLANRHGANRVVAAGLAILALSLAMFVGLGLDTPYLYVLACIILFGGASALAMSPMTASIMSAVPPRRAGQGSAMNDATRELGAALGVAVLGSVAASHYARSLQSRIDVVPAGSRQGVMDSLAQALDEASRLPSPTGELVRTTAQRAFLEGTHFAMAVGAAVALVAALVVLRYLPHTTLHRTDIETQPRIADDGVSSIDASHGSERTL